MTLNETILICSLEKAYKKAKLTGKLDVDKILMFHLLTEYDLYTRNKSEYAALNKFIKDQVTILKYQNSDTITNIKAKLPNTQITDEDLIVLPSLLVPILSNFTVPSTKQIINGTLYDTYTFSLTTLLNNYTDKDDNEFFQFQIGLTDLDGGSLYINGLTYNEAAGQYITVLASDVDEITYYTNSILSNTHSLSVRVVDKDAYNRLTISNIATVTVDRSAATSAGNQPATIGDAAIKVGNQVTTVLSLAMFTSGLTPPYNDPEADLIDAIRIDEISTANVGTFYYNGAPLITGQIITREDLEADLFIHIGATSSDIETDSFNFSARDEGSGIWVS